MPEIVLTDVHYKQMTGAIVRVAVKNRAGNVPGYLGPPLSPEFVAELKRRAATGPFFTTDQVRARLKALEAEQQRIGWFDQAYALTFRERLNAEDPGRTPEPKQGQ